MDYERWVNQQMDLLKMKSMTTNLSISGVELPKRLGEKIFKVSVDERNLKGETLMIAVIRYVDDEVKQAQYLNMLLRMGADPNLGDTKHQRTPIMFASLYKQVAAARVLLNHPNLLLGLKDRLGNTALMYAALQGEKTIIDLLSMRLAKSWSFDTVLATNRKGKNAESIAISNDNYVCALIMRSNRLRMLQRMHKQLALVHYSAKLRGWKGYAGAYRAAKIWHAKHAQRRSKSCLPIDSHYVTQIENTNLDCDHELNEIGARPRAKSCTAL